MTDERLRSEIMTALNLGSLSKGIGEGFPYLERFEGICKEYAAAQVAEKDAEIARLKAETNEISQCLLDCENAKQRLESVIDRKNEQGLSERSIIQGLKAENERLMEVVQRARQYCESGNGRGGATKLPSGEWFDEGDGTLYHAILSAISPAPEKPEEKAAPEPLTKQCRFSLAWIGSCKKPCGESGFCDQHEGVKCCKCGKQATQECPHTSQFVCGFPICDTCKHH